MTHGTEENQSHSWRRVLLFEHISASKKCYSQQAELQKVCYLLLVIYEDSQWVCWFKKKKKKKDGKVVKFTLRLQHNATRAATVSQGLWRKVWSYPLRVIHYLEIWVSPRGDDDGLLYPFPFAFKKLLKNQAQPADVACLLLDLSTQTRAGHTTATYSSGKKKETYNTPGTQSKTEIKPKETQKRREFPRGRMPLGSQVFSPQQKYYQ